MSGPAATPSTIPSAPAPPSKLAANGRTPGMVRKARATATRQMMVEPKRCRTASWVLTWRASSAGALVAADHERAAKPACRRWRLTSNRYPSMRMRRARSGEWQPLDGTSVDLPAHGR